MVSECRLKWFSLHSDTTSPNSQSRYIRPTRLKSAQYSLHNNAPSSDKLLKMDVLTSETCWAVNWHNKASVIKLVYLYSNIKLMHGPCYFTQRHIRTWQWSPISHTHPIWSNVTFSSSPSWSFGWRVEHSTPLKRFKSNRSGYLTQFQRVLPGMFPSMAETLGTLYSCKRGVLWRWWRNLTSNVSKLLFTSTVLDLLDTPLY